MTEVQALMFCTIHLISGGQWVDRLYCSILCVDCVPRLDEAWLSLESEARGSKRLFGDLVVFQLRPHRQLFRDSRFTHHPLSSQ